MDWTLRIVIAVVFIAHGMAFVKQPDAVKEQLAGMPIGERSFRVLGVAEILAAAVLLLVPAVDGPPALAWTALGGLIITMVGAIAAHVKRREPQSTVFTAAILAVLLGLAALGPA